MARLGWTNFVLYRQPSLSGGYIDKRRFERHSAATLCERHGYQQLAAVSQPGDACSPHCHKRCSLQRLRSAHADVPHFRQGAHSDAEGS